MLPSLRIASRLIRTRFPTPRTPLLPRLSQPTTTRRPFYPSNISRQFHTTPPNPSPTKYQQTQRLRWGAYIALLRWAARPSFILEAAGLGALTGGFYVYNLEEVPISGRRRFNIISEDFLQSLSPDKNQEILSKYQGQILPESDPRSKQVRRVLEKLAPNSGLPPDYNWEATVIESDEANAFVIPGGKFAIDMPKSRAQESEADHIGLLLMAKSCYDPKAAVAVWKRMEIEEQKTPRPPEMLSTHPSSRRRQTELTALLPKAYEIGLDSDCAVTGQYTEQFKKFGQELDLSF
ncbi:hypothetical protein TWF788_000623 [Orbilia oligospora]|uniref:Peptidase M48 domain-containing protein n=1 Tax=Orbilia oligospora TaxID=2813651 RepID=A0A7C8K9N9_ORBOL|nr:hypothetical protein TWF788_000623 [Orbilia oligospora]